MTTTTSNNTSSNTDEIWSTIPSIWIPETKNVIYASSYGRIRRVLKNGNFRYMGTANNTTGYVEFSCRGYKSCGNCENCSMITKFILPSPIKQNRVDDNLSRTQSKTNCRNCKRFNVNYKAHRIIMLLFKPQIEGDGELVDHISGNKTDNQVTNLRWASTTQNIANSRSRKNIRISGKSFEVRFQINGKSESKTFKKLSDALEYRNKRDIEINGEFATVVSIEQLANLTKT